MTSPSLITAPPAVKLFPVIFSDSAPTMAGLPQPRATTAACDTRPPRVVRMPSATIIPCTSSGEVSLRTRITFSPRFDASSASSAVKYTWPTAAPGEAPRPLATAVTGSANCGCSTWSSRSAEMREMASSREMARSSGDVISTAIRRAATPLRLPTRVCSIQSLPCSMVNSVSHMSL